MTSLTSSPKSSRADRTYLLSVASLAVAGCLAAILISLPNVPKDSDAALSNAVGRTVEIAAFIFGMIGASSGIAQIRQMLKTKSADDVSRIFLLMLACSFLAWLSYGILLRNWVMLIVNTVGVTVTASTLMYAIRLQKRSAQTTVAAVAAPTMTPDELLASAKTIAVVGCSANPEKTAHRVPKKLQELGWRIIPVNPTADTILGEQAYDSLQDIPTSITVDLVDVFRPSSSAPGVMQDAIDANMPAVWLQQGITSPAARHMAAGAGITYVEDECTWAIANAQGIRPAGR